MLCEHRAGLHLSNKSKHVLFTNCGSSPQGVYIFINQTIKIMNRLTIGMVLNAIALGASVILTLLAMSLGNEILIIFSLVTSLILTVLLTTWKERK